jgi:hypothetical protein
MLWRDAKRLQLTAHSVWMSLVNASGLEFQDICEGQRPLEGGFDPVTDKVILCLIHNWQSLDHVRDLRRRR